jgi:hypothetical protein
VTNLYNAVDDFSKSQTKKVREYSGILGLPVSTKVVSVPNRNGYVYVRLRDNESEIIQAYNEEVSPVWNLPVIVVRQGARWRIKGRDIERYNDWGSNSSFLPIHAFQHEFNPAFPGGDVVFVYPQQFIPLLITPSGTNGGPNVLMQLLNFKKDNGDWLQAGVTGTQSLLIYRPTDDQARIVLVYLDRTSGNPGLLINSGSSVAASTTGTHDLLQYLPDLPSSDYEPLAMARLVSGTESIEWANLYDIRQFFGGSATGTGGGVEEAPIDGLVYGRKNAGWIEVSGTSGGLPTLNADRVVITDGSGTITDDEHFEYDYVNNVLVLGAGLSEVPILGSLTFHTIGSGTSPSYAYWAFGIGTAGFNTFFAADGDWTTPTAIQHGRVIGRVARWRGHDGTGFPATRAEIRAQARGAWDTTSHGTEVITSITPSGTVTMQDMFTVNQSGADLLYGTYNISGSPHKHDSIYVRKFIGKTGSPTVNDDLSAGYLISDRWMDELNNVEYSLMDNTPGAAIWENQTHHTFTQVFGSHAQAGQVAASTTSFLSIFNVGFVASLAANPLPFSGTLKNLRVRGTSAAQPATGAMTITINVDGSATALTLTIAAGSTSTSFSDLVNTVAYTAGSLIRIDCANAASSASKPLGMVSFEIEVQTE